MSSICWQIEAAAVNGQESGTGGCTGEREVHSVAVS